MRYHWGFEYESCLKLSSLPPVGSVNGIGREELFYEAAALSQAIRKKCTKKDNIKILSVNSSISDTHILSICASMLGADITFSDVLIKTTDEYDIVFSDIKSDCATEISFDELSPIILGEIADGVSKPNITTKRIVISFVSSNGDELHKESYGESTVMKMAAEYLDASSLIGYDKQLSTLSPCSREGFLFGIIASSMVGCDVFYVQSKELFDKMPYIHPTKLLCPPRVAFDLLSHMKCLAASKYHWHPGKRSDPARRKLEKIFPKSIATARRLRYAYIHIPFGGNLSSVTVTGEFPEKYVNELAQLGVYTSSVISYSGCPLAGYRHYGDRRGYWRIPEGICADMCNVSLGGIGTLTFFGEYISPEGSAGHSHSPLSRRAEFFSNNIFVSDLYGYVTKRRRFVALKRLITQKRTE